MRAARLFEPADRLLDARLHKMSDADPHIPNGDHGIAGAEMDRMFMKRDDLIYLPSKQLALAERAEGAHPIAIACDCHFVFGNGLRVTLLRAKDLAFSKM